MKPCRKSPYSLDTRGYPRKQVNGKLRTLNRVILEQTLGRPIKPGFWALHDCGNRWCVEETHIYEGTAKQNARDRKRHGREPNRKGVKNGRSKLTVTMIRMIRKSRGVSDAELARRLGVTPPTVRYVRIGHTWGHI